MATTDGNTVLFQVLDVTAQIATTGFNRFNILAIKIFFRDTAVHFHGADSGDQYDSRRCYASLAAFNIQKFLSTQVGTKTGFGYNVVGEL